MGSNTNSHFLMARNLAQQCSQIQQGQRPSKNHQDELPFQTYATTNKLKIVAGQPTEFRNKFVAANLPESQLMSLTPLMPPSCPKPKINSNHYANSKVVFKPPQKITTDQQISKIVDSAPIRIKLAPDSNQMSSLELEKIFQNHENYFNGYFNDAEMKLQQAFKESSKGQQNEKITTVHLDFEKSQKKQMGRIPRLTMVSHDTTTRQKKKE